MVPQRQSGFAWAETFVAVLVLGVLFFLIVPVCCAPTQGLRRGQMTQTLSNMKQLHLATQQMALDGVTTGNTNLGWPGDAGGSFARWAVTLVNENYLTTNDIVKLLSAPGKITPGGKIPTKNDNGILIYTISTNLLTNTVFSSSANFINSSDGGTLDPNAAPYQKKGFVIFWMDGSGQIFPPKAAGDAQIVGGYAPLCR